MKVSQRQWKEEEGNVMSGKKGRKKSGRLHGENRKFPRRHVELPILYTFIDNIKTYGGETGNISEGGILVYLKEALLEGVRLKIEIFPPNLLGLKPIKAVTQIVWAPARQEEGWDEYLQHGLEFIEMDSGNSLKLKRLLEYIEG
jgi:c-di-GMP-binding flagellar brake protein YcgR